MESFRSLFKRILSDARDVYVLFLPLFPLTETIRHARFTAVSSVAFSFFFFVGLVKQKLGAKMLCSAVVLIRRLYTETAETHCERHKPPLSEKFTSMPTRPVVRY